MHYLLAALGSVAFGIRAFAASVLSLIGLRALVRFVVPAAIVALAAGAVLSARETATILGSRPEVEVASLPEVAAAGGRGDNVWFQFEALVSDTSLAVPADLGTFFYLAVDPADPGQGLLVRSRDNDAFFRQRTLSARLVEDPTLVAEAREALGPLPGGYDVDDVRYLDEVRAGGEPEEAFEPSDLAGEEAGGELLITGRVVSPATFAACADESGCDARADASWYTYLADPAGGGTIVLRSPHPPDALPVRLEGLYLRDSFDMRPVLDSDWFAAIEAEVPTERSFFAGQRPPITVAASWTPTIIYAVSGGLLLASLLIGYPIFGGGRNPDPRRSLEPGDGIDLEITGRMAREDGTLTLEQSPAALERLGIPELALRMWRYGMLPRDLSRRDAEDRFVAEASGEGDRLVLHERDQSALVTIERGAGGVQVAAGRLYRLMRSRPALHLRQGSTNVYLTTRSAEDRDRAAAEIAGEASALARADASPIEPSRDGAAM